MKYTKISSVVIAAVTLVLVGGISAPVFASNNDENHHEMKHDMAKPDNTNRTSWWNKNWKDTMRGNWNDDMSDRKLSASLSGNNEVPGPGDTDANGTAQVKVKPGKNEVCVAMSVKNIEPASAAHIHKGGTGVAGPVVVQLPTPNAEGFAQGCVSADKEMLKDIKKNASDYYVNVHNSAFPDGALRGQLHN